MDYTSKELKKARRLLWLIGFAKIPLIGFTRPKLVELNSEKLVIKIKLNRRTKNHLNSMYFGTLAVGADLAGGFGAFFYSRINKLPVGLVFKDFKASFLKRPDKDVYFISEYGPITREMITKTMESEERVTEQIKVTAVIDYQLKDELEVASFELGLSLKAKK